MVTYHQFDELKKSKTIAYRCQQKPKMTSQFSLFTVPCGSISRTFWVTNFFPENGGGGGAYLFPLPFVLSRVMIWHWTKKLGKLSPLPLPILLVSTPFLLSDFHATLNTSTIGKFDLLYLAQCLDTDQST